MIAIVDYGVGNLFSLKSSLSFIGQDAEISGDAATIKKADKLILPGVGAFADARAKLKESGLEDTLYSKIRRGTPVMGICLGMQLLFEKSMEYGEHEGLGLIKGAVRPLEGKISRELKIPHIGWNVLHFAGEKHPVFKYVKDGDFVYFVHSYYGADCEESLIGTTEYGVEITAAVAEKNVCGCQFHPEKSGAVGLDILRGFCQWEG
ncbi:MAG: imidazole glycerol phosphate synthase subunit HisH [Clostridiales bacterium]|nr:imidazole glycerol phosphate synthase subunit HisH [Clostridiales bacterium]